VSTKSTIQEIYDELDGGAPSHFGVALSNSNVVNAYHEAQREAIEAQARAQHFINVLRRRANGDASAWAEPASGFHPAVPEDPATATEALASLGYAL